MRDPLNQELDDLRADNDRLRAALKPFALIGEGLHAANNRSDQSTLIGASARFLNLEPLTGQDFVNAYRASSAVRDGEILMEAFKLKLAVVVIAISSVSSLAIMAGTSYVVFVLGASGWWWLLGALLVQGDCVACYKLVNAVLFDKPLKFG